MFHPSILPPLLPALKTSHQFPSLFFLFQPLVSSSRRSQLCSDAGEPVGNEQE